MAKVFLSDAHWTAFKDAWTTSTDPWKSGGDRIISDANSWMNTGLVAVTDDNGLNHAIYEQSVDPERNDYSYGQTAGAIIRTCAQAYALTGDDTYANKAIDQIYHWCLQGYKDGASPATYMVPHADMSTDHATRNTQTDMVTMYLTIPAIPYGASYLLGHPRWANCMGNSTPNAETHFEDWCQEMLVGTYGLQAKDYRDVGTGEQNNIHGFYLTTRAAFASLLHEMGRLTDAELQSELEWILVDWQAGYDDNYWHGKTTIQANGEMVADTWRNRGFHYTAFSNMAFAGMAHIAKAKADDGLTLNEAHYFWDDSTEVWDGVTYNGVQPAFYRAGNFLAYYLNDPNVRDAVRWRNDGWTEEDYYGNQLWPFSDAEILEKAGVLVLYDSIFRESTPTEEFWNAIANIESVTASSAEQWSWRPFGTYGKFSIGHLAPFYRAYDLTTSGGGGGGGGTPSSSSLADYVSSNSTNVREHWTLWGANNTGGVPQGLLNGTTYELPTVTGVTFDGSGPEGNSDAANFGASPSYINRTFAAGTDLGTATAAGDLGFSMILEIPAGYLPNDGSGDAGDLINLEEAAAGKYTYGAGVVLRDSGAIRLVVADGSSNRSWWVSTETLQEGKPYFLSCHYRASDGAVRCQLGEIGVDDNLATMTMTEGSGSVVTGGPNFSKIDLFELGERSSDGSDSYQGLLHSLTFDTDYQSAAEMEGRYDSIGGTSSGPITLEGVPGVDSMVGGPAGTIITENSETLAEHIQANSAYVREHFTLIGANNDAEGDPQGTLNGATYELPSLQNVTFTATGIEKNPDAALFGSGGSHIWRDFPAGTDLGAPTVGEHNNNQLGFSLIFKLPAGFLPNDASGDVADLVSLAQGESGKYNYGAGVTIRDDGTIRMVVSKGSANRAWWHSSETVKEDTFYYLASHYQTGTGAVRMMLGEIGVDDQLTNLTVTNQTADKQVDGPGWENIDRFEIGGRVKDGSDSFEGIIQGVTIDEDWLSDQTIQARYAAAGIPPKLTLEGLPAVDMIEGGTGGEIQIPLTITGRPGTDYMLGGPEGQILAPLTLTGSPATDLWVGGDPGYMDAPNPSYLEGTPGVDGFTVTTGQIDAPGHLVGASHSDPMVGGDAGKLDAAAVLLGGVPAVDLFSVTTGALATTAATLVGVPGSDSFAVTSGELIIPVDLIGQTATALWQGGDPGRLETRLRLRGVVSYDIMRSGEGTIEGGGSAPVSGASPTYDAFLVTSGELILPSIFIRGRVLDHPIREGAPGHVRPSGNGLLEGVLATDVLGAGEGRVYVWDPVGKMTISSETTTSMTLSAEYLYD